MDHIQDFVTYPVHKLYDLKYYVNNRWVSRSHSLTAHARDIKPGDWCDVGNRILFCLFNELVDFVEIETAGHHIAWGNKEACAKYSAPFYATGWFKWRTWRCAQAGLDHLDWAASLRHDDEWVNKDDPLYDTPTRQAIVAAEIKALYVWWKEVYPNRPDPYDVSGWSALCEARRAQDQDQDFWTAMQDKTPNDRAASRVALDLCDKIQAEYAAEDELMLVRLIKIRDSLWT